MSKNELTETSRFISLILRHKPEVIGITLDEHGWADTQALIEGVSRTHPLTMELLERIVAEDEKQRYSWNEDRTKIRANQGHSVQVDVELEQKEPPEVLYHGTVEKNRASIEEKGLLRGTRLYVHLSKDVETAVKVAARRKGKRLIYEVAAGRMFRDGFMFYQSVNGVWMTNKVPIDYLHLK